MLVRMWRKKERKEGRKKRKKKKKKTLNMYYFCNHRVVKAK